LRKHTQTHHNSRTYRKTVPVAHELTAALSLANTIVIIVKVRMTRANQTIVTLNLAGSSPVALLALVPVPVIPALEDEAALRVTSPRLWLARSVIATDVGSKLRNCWVEAGCQSCIAAATTWADILLPQVRATASNGLVVLDASELAHVVAALDRSDGSNGGSNDLCRVNKEAAEISNIRREDELGSRRKEQDGLKDLHG